MKTLLISVNSKFIHSNLAVRYLKEACSEQCGHVSVMEFSINDKLEAIFFSILRQKPDVAAFSCYIWNIDFVLRLSGDLKKVLPDIIIILGGPEVSFCGGGLAFQQPCIDYIIKGEGEEALPSLLKLLQASNGKSDNGFVMAGSEYKPDNKKAPCDGRIEIITDMNKIPSPYTEEYLKHLKNKIVYYESSRGCPYNCSYCMSSTLKGVRYLNIDRVVSELNKLTGAGAGQIKFVDRTFNSNKERVKDILLFIISLPEKVNTGFHFELNAAQLDEELLEIFKRIPVGRVQIEAGIQSVNDTVLKAVNRKMNNRKLFKNLKYLIEQGNVHVHVDLIAGLPYEDMNLFKDSFNSVYRLKAHHFQLGFLKLLYGTQIRQEEEKHGYKYRDYPPYEVLENNYLKADELMVIKDIEECLERYYNSGRFSESLDFAVRHFNSPFEFYLDFASFSRNMGCLDRPLSGRDLYTVILKYWETRGGDGRGIIEELLKYDFFRCNMPGKLPDGLKVSEYNRKEQCFRLLKDDSFVKKYLPHFLGQPAKEIYKRVLFEFFPVDIEGRKEGETALLFDYTSRHPVTGLFKSIMIQNVL